METTLFKTKSGSHLYGTNTPESDVDFIEVYLKEPEWYIGITAVDDPKGKMTVSDDVDTTRFEFRHFLRLCLAYNPNVVEVLHSPDIVAQSEAAATLYYNSYKFVSKRSIKALTGYCIRMRADVKESWRTGKQGTKRKALIKKHGYDTKAAAHAWRLGFTAARLAATGVHVVDFTNHPTELGIMRDIREGKMDKQHILDHIEGFMAVADSNYAELPDEPCRDWVNLFCIDTLRRHING